MSLDINADVPLPACSDLQRRIVRALWYGRTTLDLLCDSLRIQCHVAQQALDGLTAAGLVRSQGSVYMRRLAYELTENGQRVAQAQSAADEAAHMERRLAPDDVAYLRAVAGSSDGRIRSMEFADPEWSLGATRQRLWEAGLVRVGGVLLPRATITDRGRAELAKFEGASR